MSIFKSFGSVPAHGISDTFTITGGTGPAVTAACDAVTINAFRRNREVMDGVGRVIGIYYYNNVKNLNLPFYLRATTIQGAIDQSDLIQLQSGDRIQIAPAQAAYKFGGLGGQWLINSIERTQVREDWQSFSLQAVQYELLA